MEHSYANMTTGDGYGTTSTTGGGSSCYTCGKRSFSMSRCSACKVATYCSSTCQKAGWKAHKKNCKEHVKRFADEESLAAAGKQGNLSSADWLRIGNRAQLDCNFEDAVEAFKKTLKLDPHDFVARNNLGNCYRSLGDPALAFETHTANIRQLRAALKGVGPEPRGPANQTGEEFIAMMLTNAGNARNHMGMLRREISGFEGAQGLFEEAAALFREAMAECPTSEEPYNSLGNILVRLRRPAEAFKVREQGAERFPADYLKQYNFALSLMHHCEPPDYVRAAETLITASKLEAGGEDPDTWVQLGECRTMHAQAVLECSSGDANAKLARSLLKKARADLAKGLQLDPSHVGAARIAHMISSITAHYPDAKKDTKEGKGRKGK